jgi:MFS family permease
MSTDDERKSGGTLYVKMDDDQQPLSSPPPEELDKGKLDSSYAWYVIIPCSGAVAFSVMGVQYSAGVINTALLEPREQNGFGEGPATTAWVTAVAIGMLMLSMGPGGQLQNNIGQRAIVMLGGTMVAAGLFISSFATELWMLLFSFSILCSVGGGFAYLGAATITGKWFTPDQRAMAMAISSSGSGVGTVVLGTFTESFDDWREAFRYLALIAGVCIVLPAFWMVPPTASAKSDSALTYMEVLDTGGLRYFMLVQMVFGLGCWNPIVHNLEAGVEQSSLTVTQASTAISIGFGIGAVLGRPVAAKILGHVGRMNGFPAILALMGVTAGLVPFMRGSFAPFLINNFFYGWGFGAWISVLPPMTADMVGMAKFPMALGMVYASPGVTMMLGPVLCGYIKEETSAESYNLSYYFSAFLMILAGAMAVFLKYMKA